MEFLRRLILELPVRVFLAVVSLAAVIILICIFYAIGVAPCTTTIFGLEFGPQRPCSSEPSLPSKTILPYYGSHKDIPDGWSVCKGDGTPDLDERFLIGTNDPREVGKPTGTDKHDHNFQATSAPGQGKFQRPPEGANNTTGGRNWIHKHKVTGATEGKKHIPLSVKVWFLCKD